MIITSVCKAVLVIWARPLRLSKINLDHGSICMGFTPQRSACRGDKALLWLLATIVLSLENTDNRGKIYVVL